MLTSKKLGVSQQSGIGINNKFKKKTDDQMITESNTKVREASPV